MPLIKFEELPKDMQEFLNTHFKDQVYKVWSGWNFKGEPDYTIYLNKRFLSKEQIQALSHKSNFIELGVDGDQYMWLDFIR